MLKLLPTIYIIVYKYISVYLLDILMVMCMMVTGSRIRERDMDYWRKLLKRIQHIVVDGPMINSVDMEYMMIE